MTEQNKEYLKLIMNYTFGKANEKEKTVQQVFDELNKEQKNAVYAIIGETLSQNEPKKETMNPADIRHSGTLLGVEDTPGFKYSIGDHVIIDSPWYGIHGDVGVVSRIDQRPTMRGQYGVHILDSKQTWRTRYDRTYWLYERELTPTHAMNADGGHFYASDAWKQAKHSAFRAADMLDALRYAWDDAQIVQESFKSIDKQKKEKDNKKENTTMRPYDITNVIFNAPAVIVFWRDGTKTVVKAEGNDEFEPEKGLAMAIAKKAFGNKGNYYDIFKAWLPTSTEVKK